MNLKIAVAFHKQVPVDNFIKNKDIYVPIFGGKELYKGNSQFLKNMIGDNTGDNISTLNPRLNEATVLYWFAHHLEEFGNPDFIGFDHYRRFLIFDQSDLNQNTIIASKYNLIFYPVGGQLCQQETTMQNLNFYLSFLNNLFYSDLQSLKTFINSTSYYVANMFIMPRSIFDEYTKFLDCLVDFSKMIMKYKPQFFKDQPRALAMFIERMTGYFIWRKEKEGIKIIDKGIVVPQSEQERFKEFYNFGNYYIINDNGEYVKVK